MPLTKNHSIVLIVLIPFSSACFWTIPYQKSQKQFRVMINPSGDSQTTGRIIDKNYERTLTYNLAERIKNNLAITAPHVTVLLSRNPAQANQSGTIASIANRSNIDLYIALSAYAEAVPQPHITLYYFSSGFVNTKPMPTLSFIPLSHAHHSMHKHSKEWAQRSHDILFETVNNTLFQVRGPFGVPIVSLKGILAPSFALEIGIKHEDHSHQIVSVVTEIISNLSQQK